MGQSQGIPQSPEGPSQENNGRTAQPNGATDEGIFRVKVSNCPNTSPRNLRHTFQMQHNRRQSRSKSLEPNAALDIRTIGHRKSSRFGTKTELKKRGQNLWNPEKAATLLIGQQLQNPHAQPPTIQLQTVSIHLKQFRNLSDKTDLLEDNKKDGITGLSAHQIQILQKIWERSPEVEISDCARNIMAHLLRSNAQMYQFFDLLGLSDREISNSPIFERQSANFVVVLDFVLGNLLEEIQKVCLALQHLGTQHARLPFPIETHHWALFSRCFEDNPPKEVFLNAEGHDLWKTMISFMIAQMRIGYDRAIDATSPTAQNAILSSPRLGAYRRPSEGKKEIVLTQQRGKLAGRSKTLAATEEMEDLKQNNKEGN
ncbi:hypothetical protein niasHT_013550 [Heterodera trifolii]|uniref:Globin domain-containing protein n=1 Tax=Heterodera trifolii TaxID=157864 RepID=A0ABD2LFJ0_9BILA